MCTKNCLRTQMQHYHYNLTATFIDYKFPEKESLCKLINHLQSMDLQIKLI